MIGFTRPDLTTIRIEFAHEDYFSKRVPTYCITTCEQSGWHYTPHGVDLGKESRTVYVTRCHIVAKGPIIDATATEPGRALAIGCGASYCSIHERLREGQSIREEGRKRSLIRALTHALELELLTPSEKNLLLAAYFSRPRGKAARKLQEEKALTKQPTQPSTELSA